MFSYPWSLCKTPNFDLKISLAFNQVCLFIGK